MKSRAKLLTYRFAVSQLCFIALCEPLGRCNDLRVLQDRLLRQWASRMGFAKFLTMSDWLTNIVRPAKGGTMSAIEKEKHTPGPWRTTVPCSSTLVHREIRAEDDTRIAEVGFGYQDQPQELANARLIAAAPELLEMLALALPYVEEAESDPVKKRLSS